MRDLGDYVTGKILPKAREFAEKCYRRPLDDMILDDAVFCIERATRPVDMHTGFQEVQEGVLIRKKLKRRWSTLYRKLGLANTSPTQEQQRLLADLERIMDGRHGNDRDQDEMGTKKRRWGGNDNDIIDGKE